MSGMKKQGEAERSEMLWRVDEEGGLFKQCNIIDEIV
jgi:hypothetical protein